MARITWTGGTLENVWAGTPAARFLSWEPRPMVVGQRRTLLGSGLPRVWAYREQHGASFRLVDLPASAMADMIALALHVAGGGTFTVTCDDTTHAVYDCVLAPDADPPLPELTDTKLLRYSMTFTVLNTAGTPMVCVYS